MNLFACAIDMNKIVLFAPSVWSGEVVDFSTTVNDIKIIICILNYFSCKKYLLYNSQLNGVKVFGDRSIFSNYLKTK